MEPKLKAAYMATRKRLASKGFDCRASRAIEIARADIERGQSHFYYEDGLASYQNAEFGGGARWIESPEQAGLRFVAFADEIAGRAVDHTGWYCDEHGDGDTARGAVYQMPARDGRAVYVEAIRVGRKRSSGAWEDSSRDGSAALFLRNGRHIGEHGGADTAGRPDEDAAISAAMGADHEAQRYAEREREYQAAFSAGCEYRELIDDVGTERRAFLALRAEMNESVGTRGLHVNTALAIRLEEMAERYREKKRKAAELFDEHGRAPWAERKGYAGDYSRSRELRIAFHEGAGLKWESADG